MNRAVRQIICMILAITAALALGATGFAADGERDIEILHAYFDREGRQEQRVLTQSVGTASPTRLSGLTRPVLGYSGVDYEYDVVDFHLEIFYTDSSSEILDWTGAEVAAISWQFLDHSKVAEYEVVVSYDNPRPVTATTAPSGGGVPARSSRGSGGSSSPLGYIGVVGLPENPAPIGATVKLTTIPSDTSEKFDADALALERRENGDYLFEIKKAGTHSITFSRSGYHDRTVTISGEAGSVTVSMERETDNPDTDGAPTDWTATDNPDTGGAPADRTATDNPNTGDGRRVWMALLSAALGAVALVLLRPRARREQE